MPGVDLRHVVVQFEERGRCSLQVLICVVIVLLQNLQWWGVQILWECRVLVLLSGRGILWSLM